MIALLAVDDFIDAHFYFIYTIIFLIRATISLKVIHSGQIVHHGLIVLLQKNVLEKAEVLTIQSTDGHLPLHPVLILNLTKIVAWCEEGGSYASFMKLMP